MAWASFGGGCSRGVQDRTLWPSTPFHPLRGVHSLWHGICLNYCMRYFAFLLLSIFSLGIPACLPVAGGAGDDPTGEAVMNLDNALWGRLVDVIDSEGVLVHSDVVVVESLYSDGVDYEFSNNILTQAEIMQILHPLDSDEFEHSMRRARAGLSSLKMKGMGDAPPFAKVARNGAIRLEFTEHLDPVSVNRSTIQVMSGNPANFNNEVRYIVKDEYGPDGEPVGVVVIDAVISAKESTEVGVPINGIGYPASLDQVSPSLCVRIPTRLDPLFGQNQILTSQDGTRYIEILTDSDGNPAEPAEFSVGNTSGFPDVIVRAARSGNALDEYNGYLLDLTRPTLITELESDLMAVVKNPDPLSSHLSHLLTYRIRANGCSEIVPKAGDALAVGDAVFLFAETVSDDPLAYQVVATLLGGDPPLGDFSGAPLFSLLTSSYSALHQSLQLCWVKFLPEPVELPATGVDPMASLTVSFDEAIGADTVTSLDTFVFASYSTDQGSVDGPYQAGQPVGDYIDSLLGYGTFPQSATGSGRIRFGPVSPSQDARSFTIAPVSGISDAHNEGSLLRMCVALRDGSEGVRDLAGNPLSLSGFVAGSDDQAEILTLAGAPSSWPRSRYFSLRCNAVDENGDNLLEYTGQYTMPRAGFLSGRELRSFSRLADTSNPYIGQRLQFGQGLMTPLTPAGAVLMTVLGYHHLGFGLLSPDAFNLDVVGLSWAPFGGSVYDSTFDRYSLGLSHSERFPDDFINPSNGYPKYPKSGIKWQAPFDNNVLGRNEGIEEVVVFDTQYNINAMNMFMAPSGTQMMPWPEFEKDFTWRDTSIPQTIVAGSTAGQDTRGVPPEVTGQEEHFEAGKIPSIGSPLLMRFRSYPMGGFNGQNGFQIQIMVGSSSLPAFRVFSAGGMNGDGDWEFVIPDVGESGTKPQGFPGGGTTAKRGPELYWAQVDFAIRVSRVFTHWFTFGGTVETISNVTLEQAFNPGTEILVDFRGAELVDVSLCSQDPIEASAFNATTDFDSYGDYQGLCSTVSNTTEWSSDTQLIIDSSSTAFQVRLTFVSSTETALEPELDALGFAWTVH